MTNLDHRIGRDIGLRLLMLVVLLSGAQSGPALAGMQRAAFWNQPETVQVLSESALDEVCQFQWGRTYNLFDYPVAVCSRQYINSGNTVGDYFVLDKGQNKIRVLGTRVLNGTRKLAFNRELTGGFNGPESITLGTQLTGTHRQLFIADSGNNRIGRSEIDFASGIPYPLAVTYIYSGNGSVGPLRQPHDIDYCEYHDPQVGNLVLVADTYNHRVLGMNTQGVVQWTFGSGPGSGTMQFKYPYAVTGVSLDDYGGEAIVFVGDRGNNRIVRLHLTGVSSVQWDGEFSFGGGSTVKDAGPGSSGIEDVEVDDTDLSRNGVFVLHSGEGKVLQLDLDLTTVLQSRDSFAEQGALYDLDTSRGMLSVLTPYTSAAGLELFTVPADIAQMSLSTSRFWNGENVTATMNVTSAAALDAWVVRVQSSTKEFVRNLVVSQNVPPSQQQTTWDGRDGSGQSVSTGSYRVICRVTDAFTAEVGLDSLDVEYFNIPSVHGHLSSNQTWSGSVYTSGDVVIESGASLTINAGTTVWVAQSDQGPNLGQIGGLVEVNVEGGSLVVNGTAANPVKFQAWNNGGPATAANDKWAGIWIGDSAPSSATIDHAEIRNAYRGLQARSKVSLKNSTIENCKYIGITLAGDSANTDSMYVQNTTIRRIRGSTTATGAIGVNVLGKNAWLKLDNCVIDSCETGVEVYTKAQIYTNLTTIKHSTVSNDIYIHGRASAALVQTTAETANTSALLVEDAATVSTSDCTFKKSDIGADVSRGLLCTNPPTCTILVPGGLPVVNIYNSIFTANDVGLQVAEVSGVSISGSHFDGNTSDGVSCLSGADIAVTTSTLNANTVGIRCDDSSPYILANTISENNGGIVCEGATNPLIQQNRVWTNNNGISFADDATARMEPCGSTCPPCGSANSFKGNTGFHASNLTEGYAPRFLNRSSL